MGRGGGGREKEGEGERVLLVVVGVSSQPLAGAGGTHSGGEQREKAGE